jgi:hypothetical protein
MVPVVTGSDGGQSRISVSGLMIAKVGFSCKQEMCLMLVRFATAQAWPQAFGASLDQTLCRGLPKTFLARPDTLWYLWKHPCNTRDPLMRRGFDVAILLRCA